jgi:hypothetical protein
VRTVTVLAVFFASGEPPTITLSRGRIGAALASGSDSFVQQTVADRLVYGRRDRGRILVVFTAVNAEEARLFVDLFGEDLASAFQAVTMRPPSGRPVPEGGMA